MNGHFLLQHECHELFCEDENWWNDIRSVDKDFFWPVINLIQYILTNPKEYPKIQNQIHVLTILQWILNSSFFEDMIKFNDNKKIKDFIYFCKTIPTDLSFGQTDKIFERFVNWITTENFILKQLTKNSDIDFISIIITLQHYLRIQEKNRIAELLFGAKNAPNTDLLLKASSSKSKLIELFKSTFVSNQMALSFLNKILDKHLPKETNAAPIFDWIGDILHSSSNLLLNLCISKKNFRLLLKFSSLSTTTSTEFTPAITKKIVSRLKCLYGYQMIKCLKNDFVTCDLKTKAGKELSEKMVSSLSKMLKFRQLKSEETKIILYSLIFKLSHVVQKIKKTKDDVFVIKKSISILEKHIRKEHQLDVLLLKLVQIFFFVMFKKSSTFMLLTPTIESLLKIHISLDLEGRKDLDRDLYEHHSYQVKRRKRSNEEWLKVSLLRNELNKKTCF